MTYPRVLATLHSKGYISVISELSQDGLVHFVANADIDDDGTGPGYGDPYHQNDTTLHYQGQPLNADEDLYVVVPPLICRKVRGIVLGCKVTVTNRRNGNVVIGVIGDIGPSFKDGEVSIATAKALDIDWNPNTGGEDSAVIEYIIEPGVPAMSNGKTYTLQHYGG
jgi:hypothetical protein